MDYNEVAPDEQQMFVHITGFIRVSPHFYV